MDVPLFGDQPNKRRRQINLGGTYTATSHSDIVQEAKLRRLQREEQKRRQDAALLLQRIWRSYVALGKVRQSLRATFSQDLCTLTALRCLVLLGQDEDALGRWSLAILEANSDMLLQHDQSWLVLFQRVSVMLLCSLSTDLHSQYAQAHLRTLSLLLSSNPRRAEISQYLVSHGLYSNLRQAVMQLPVPSRPSPSITPLVDIIAAPLSYPELLPISLRDFLINILTIPLFPNRILPALGSLSARLPLASIHVISLDIIYSLELRPIESRIHLLANLVAFMPPRYATLPPSAFATYLQLCALLMNALPTHALEPSPDKQDSARNWADDDSEDEEPVVELVTSFELKERPPPLDDRTRKRLLILPSSDHISSLLRASQKASLLHSVIAYSLALCTVWPSRRDKVLGAIVMYNRGSLVKEIYRTFVRSSPLGNTDAQAEILNSENAPHWPPLLLLADLYTQALLTMGDDEFFSTGMTPSGARNPLSLDELTGFSRQLLNIAFTLYWSEDPNSAQEAVPGLGQMKWENVREKATKCLQALHARDSRRPFTPPEHWLITAHVDMNTFVKAAAFEERQLSNPEDGRVVQLNKRQLAYLSPRLGVLNNIPFAIPFDVRVEIFREFIQNDIVSRGYTPWRGLMGTAKVVVRRDHIAQDGFDKLADADLRAPIAITFIDQFGNEEAGIDGGGVFKEFLTSLTREVFDTDRGLWLATQKNELYPAPHSYATDSHSLAWFRFIGRILGKALYEGILVDIAFAGFFLAKWLGKQSWLDDLASLDPELYQGLMQLKHYTGDPEDLSLNFTVAQEEFGVTKSIDLIPNGSNIPVTRENKLQYMYLVAHYKLTKQIKKQSAAFFEGLSEIIDPKWLRMFNQQELQILLGGVDSPIDVADLRTNTQYGGLYDDHHPTITAFWEIVDELSHEDRRKLLRFATSCSRPPLLGFKELNPRFSIRDATDDQSRLPTASTCVNLLKLPRYTNKRVMKEKLSQAINSNAGFDLS